MVRGLSHSVCGMKERERALSLDVLLTSSEKLSSLDFTGTIKRKKERERAGHSVQNLLFPLPFLKP